MFRNCWQFTTQNRKFMVMDPNKLTNKIIIQRLVDSETLSVFWLNCFSPFHVHCFSSLCYSYFTLQYLLFPNYKILKPFQIFVKKVRFHWFSLIYFSINPSSNPCGINLCIWLTFKQEQTTWCNLLI